MSWREVDLPGDAHTLRLRLCRWGPDDGVPIVILHGYLEQGAAWAAVASRLAARLGRPVVAPDHRGHGLSAHVGPGGWYHFWDYVADVDRLVRELVGDHGQVDLVGHSMGGTIAGLFAGSRPEAVHRLALVEGLGPPDLDGTELDRARAFLADAAAPPRHPCMPDLDHAVARMRRFARHAAPELLRLLAARVTRPVTPDDVVDDPQPDGLVWTWDPRHRGRAPTAFRAEAHRRFLSAITAPTLLVDGEASPMHHLPDRAARAACLGRRRDVVIPAAGHLLHHDTPEALAHALAFHLEDPWTTS